jgi:hypothetical protein
MKIPCANLLAVLTSENRVNQIEVNAQYARRGIENDSEGSIDAALKQIRAQPADRKTAVQVRLAKTSLQSPQYSINPCLKALDERGKKPGNGFGIIGRRQSGNKGSPK